MPFFIKRIRNNGFKNCRLNNLALSKWVLCLSGREMVPTGQRPLSTSSLIRPSYTKVYVAFVKVKSLNTNLDHHQPGAQLRRSQTAEEALPKAH